MKFMKFNCETLSDSVLSSVSRLRKELYLTHFQISAMELFFEKIDVSQSHKYAFVSNFLKEDVRLK